MAPRFLARAAIKRLLLRSSRRLPRSSSSTASRPLSRLLAALMDFWNRLIGGSGSTPVRKQPAPSPPANPQQRVAKFKRAWQTLLHEWRNARENDPTAQQLLGSHLHRLTDLLIEEEKRSARLCVNYCYEQQVFIAIGKIGQQGLPSVIRECIFFFSTLIDNEDEDFLGNESFAQSLIAFLRTTSQRSTPTLHSEFVELLFAIAAKIRLNPGILGVWFTSNGEEQEGPKKRDERERFAGETKKEDFPLFYLLIDYVHSEGRVGDFARTGLLYIIEAASSAQELEQWIVDSDLATLMASGLGALYSQLSRKLVVAYPKDDPPAILALSDFSSSPPAFGAEPSNSPEFQTHLETFLSYLIFWQDVLEHCRSSEVKQTLLDHFHVLFLQQLLYPSLLESSDVDGGSSVAVLTYLRVVLDTLEHPDIIHLILTYLMGLPSADKPEPPKPTDSPSVARRRKSLDLLSQAADLDDNPTPQLFNLGDLISTSLASRSQQTVAATLRLVSTLLRKHYPYNLQTLLKIHYVPDGPSGRTIGAHNKEMELFFTMITDIAPDMNAAQSYADHLKDCQTLLESHPTTTRVLGLRDPTYSRIPSSVEEKLKKVRPHTILPTDPLLKHVVELLNTFYSNTVETNLILTGVVVDLAACGWMRPEGWLLFDPAAYDFAPDDVSENEAAEEDEAAELDALEDELAEIMGDTPLSENSPELFAERERRRLRSLKNARRTPSFTTTPPIITALQSLVRQIQVYRNEIADFDTKLAERRRAFEFNDELNDALTSSAPPPPPPPKERGPYSMLDQISARNLARPTSSHSTSSRIMGDPQSQSQSPFEGHVADTTTRRVRVLTGVGRRGVHLPPPPEGAKVEEEREFTLSHLLTNVMILQEFILELAALVQVRASLYGDVKFA